MEDKEKTAGQQLADILVYKSKSCFEAADKQAVADYCEGYKKILVNGKTAREVVKESVA